jgi:Cdc6-like AAA superfamily ATPase
VCGTPGAGKTMTVGRLLREAKEEGIVESAFVVNCTGLGKPAAFYAAVGDVLGVGRAKEDLVRATTEGRGIVVLMLDEVDFLPQKLLYEVYELPALPRSRIAIIGIANRLDLPLKSLPLLTATNRAPRVISFKPYTADDLTAIVRARLSDSGEGADAVLHPVAITLAAKKIASMSGDARRMLDVCREALLAVHESAGANPIGIVSALLSRAGRTTAAVDTVRTLPVQHQLALCCVANAEKRMVAAAERGSVASRHFAKRITIGGLYESFKAMCVKTTIPCLGISDFTDMLESMAVSHALLHISDVKRTKAGGVGGGRGERGRVVRLDTASIADVQSGCSDTPLLRLLVGNEL